MSPRKSRRQPPPVVSLPLGPERAETWPDGDWIVRRIPGAAVAKAYRCPGCDQEIPPGMAHLVAWPAEAAGVDARRHWHRACWERRLQRRPGQGRTGQRRRG